MIKPGEISKTANKEYVRPQQIEKDYIISWILWGVYNHDLLKNTLIFKGGTCIKKVHIEDYRYSEDLDFTLHPDLEQKISDDELYVAFNEVFVTIKETANIDLSIPEDYKEVHESGGIKFFINYVGPLGGKGDHIKTDVSKGEKLEFEVEKLNLLNPYSDIAKEDEVTIQCYGFEEMVIENKAEHKGHNPAEFIQKVNEKEQIFEKAWTANLSNQIKDLRRFRDVWRDFQKQLRKFEKCT